MNKYFESDIIEDEEEISSVNTIGETGTLADYVTFPEPSSLPEPLKFEGTIEDLEKIKESFLNGYDNSPVFTLQEARTGISDAIRSYVESNPESPSYDDFVAKGFNDIPNATKTQFQVRYKELATGLGAPDLVKSNKPSTSNKAEEEKKLPKEDTRPEFDISKIDKNDPMYKFLDAMNSAAETADDESLSVEDSVEEKFYSVYTVTDRVASGRSLKDHAFICGDAGIGKSYTIERAVEHGMAENPSHPQLVKVSGSIGKSLSSIVLFFYKNRNNKIILLDDCDGFILEKNQEVQNILKAMLDPSGHEIHTSTSIRNLVNKMLKKEMKENVANTQSRIDRFGKVILNEGIFDDDDFDDEDEDEDMIDIDEEIPEFWTFNSRLIMISNLKMSDVNDAVRSRCDCVEITLTKEEFMLRAEQILADLQVTKNSTVSPKLIEWAKKESFMAFKSVVFADGYKGLPRIPINVQLQFRMFGTLTGLLLARYDHWCSSQKPAIEKDTVDPQILQRFEKECMIKFIKIDLKNALAGDTRPDKK